jgi:heme exporter protein D
VDTREWILTAAVILVPLIIAVVVTLWSLKQVQYRRKAWKPRSARSDAANGESGRRVPAPGDTDAS